MTCLFLVFENTKNIKNVLSKNSFLFFLNLVFFIFFRKKKLETKKVFRVLLIF